MGCDLQEHAWGREFPLIGIRLASPHHADLVVGEFEMSARKLVLRHMARDAVLGADRACGGVRLSGVWCPTLIMAAQALGIVECHLAHSRTVGIMAGEAADAPIPAAAVLQPIWLESDVIDSAHPHRLDHQPSAMA